MKAMVMTAAGGLDVLRMSEVERPRIGHDTQMLVRLKAAGVNPVDTKLRAKGTYFPERIPAILGCDGAGVVEEVGPAVTRFAPGDEVFFCNGGIGGDPGNYAQYTVIDHELAAHKPTSLSFEQAAAVPLVLITAWESLHDRAGLKSGETALIHAAAGGVGHVAVQLAKAAGAWVAGTVSSEEKGLFASSLGVDRVIHYRDRDFVAETLEWTHGNGARLVFDTVGGEVFNRSITAAAPYGDLVTLLQPGEGLDWKGARVKNLRISLELMLTPMYRAMTERQRHQRGILEQGAALIDGGRLAVHVADTLPLADAAEAHRRIEAGGMTGKLVLAID